MPTLSAADRQWVEEAIGAAEASTSGEIFVVIADASDDYIYIPNLWAALIALTVPLPLVYLSELAPQWIFGLQLATFAVVALVLMVPPIRLAVVPPAVKRGRAHRHAQELFLSHNIHTTPNRTGLLLFVSLAEHHAEVVADSGIYRKVEPETWEHLVERLVEGIAARGLVPALTAAIAESGELLSRHFPQAADGPRRNILPNALVEL